MSEHLDHTPPGDDFDWDAAYQGDGSDTGPLDELLLGEALERRPGTVLDLGCGAGGNLIGLAKLGWVATGIDGSSKALASARISADAAGIDNAVFEVADITQWTPHQQYDLVISSYALPSRGPSRTATLATATAAVAPGGSIVIAEWDGADADWGEPDLFVTPDELRQAVLGFAILRAEQARVQTPHGSETANIVVAQKPDR